MRTGRKIGIQLRCILVEEIYTKALRRAMTAGNAQPAEDDAQPDTEANPDAEANSDAEAGENVPLLDSSSKDPTAEKPEQQKLASQGKIVTLMSVDTESLRTFACYLHEDIVRLPLSVILTFAGLFALLRWSAFAGCMWLSLHLTLLISGRASLVDPGYRLAVNKSQ